MPNWWRKAGNPGHGYQLNNEKDMMAFFDPLINHPESGTLLRARSEMDEMFKGWFQEAPVWNAYWLNLWALHFGLDIFVHSADAVANPAYREGFEFFSRLRRREGCRDQSGRVVRFARRPGRGRPRALSRSRIRSAANCAARTRRRPTGCGAR